MTSKPEMTSYEEEPARTDAQEVVRPSDLPRWVVALFGSEVLALTVAWMYLLGLWVHDVWSLIFR